MLPNAEIDKSGRIWYLKEKGDLIRIGLTQSTIDEIREECWHILPNFRAKPLKEGVPLFSFETNDRLVSVITPFAGYLVDFSDKAQNDPQMLTEDEPIATISTQPHKQKQAKEITSIIWDDLSPMPILPVDAVPTPPTVRPLTVRRRGRDVRHGFYITGTNEEIRTRQRELLQAMANPNSTARTLLPLSFTAQEAAEAFGAAHVSEFVQRGWIVLEPIV